MKRLLITLVLTFSFTGAAQASGVARAYYAHPAAKIAALEQTVNRIAGMSNADCWLYGGNAKIGYRSTACVAGYTINGLTVRFKIVSTMLSCTKQRQMIIIPGRKNDVSTEAIKWKTGTCKIS